MDRIFIINNLANLLFKTFQENSQYKALYRVIEVSQKEKVLKQDLPEYRPYRDSVNSISMKKMKPFIASQQGTIQACLHDRYAILNIAISSRNTNLLEI